MSIESMLKITISVLSMRPAQQAIDASPARYKVINCRRRSGKTISSLEWLLFGVGGSAIEGKPVAFFSLTRRLVPVE